MSWSTARRSRPSRQPGVVAGGDGVEAERQRAGRQRGELDPLVAPHAGVRSLAAGIGRHEVVDHVLFEPVREIPDVEGDVEHVGDPAGVAGVFFRAAAPRPGAQRPRRSRQRQVHADHVMAGIDHPGGGDRRVDAPAHRDQNPHYSNNSRARQRRLPRPVHRTGQHVERRVDVGVDTGVTERKSQRTAGAGRVGAHRGQHVRRLRDTGRACRSGRAFDSLGVQQHQQRIALAAAEGEVRVARKSLAPVAPLR